VWRTAPFGGGVECVLQAAPLSAQAIARQPRRQRNRCRLEPGAHSHALGRNVVLMIQGTACETSRSISTDDRLPASNTKPRPWPPHPDFPGDPSRRSIGHDGCLHRTNRVTGRPTHDPVQQHLSAVGPLTDHQSSIARPKLVERQSSFASELVQRLSFNTATVASTLDSTSRVSARRPVMIVQDAIGPTRFCSNHKPRSELAEMPFGVHRGELLGVVRCGRSALESASELRLRACWECRGDGAAAPADVGDARRLITRRWRFISGVDLEVPQRRRWWRSRRALVGRAVGLLGRDVEVDEIGSDEVVGAVRHSPTS